MAIVSCNGTQYPCSKAVKGEDYVKLIDSTGHVTASFDGVVDFSVFDISDGTWSEPENSDASDSTTIAVSMVLHSTASKWTLSNGVYSKVYGGETLSRLVGSEIPIVTSVSDVDWAHTYLTVTVGAGSITVRTTTLPAADTSLSLIIISSVEGISFTE